MLRHAKQLVVTSYHPWRKWVVVTVLIVAVPLGAWGLFDYGRYRAGFDSWEAAKEHRALQGAVDDLQQGNDDLRQRLATNERAMEIDKQAYADINGSLESMQNEISELKEEVAFYRGIVAPQESAQGVRVQKLQLTANGGEHGYSYKLVLVQTTKDAPVTRGAIRLTVQGLLDQAQKEYSFGELSGQNTEGEKFRFKYFGKTEGDIILPANFIPTRVVVHVSVDSPTHSDVEAVFAWQDVIS
jgi:hypothetical protein